MTIDCSKCVVYTAPGLTATVDFCPKHRLAVNNFESMREALENILKGDFAHYIPSKLYDPAKLILANFREQEVK